MDQPVEKRSRRYFVVKDDGVHVGDRGQVHEIWKIPSAKSYSIGVEGRWWYAGTLENDGPDAFEQRA